MPKVLTEAAAFTPTVTVPEGIDDRSNAADVVEALAQALANRTQHLQAHTAKIDAANTFTRGQIVHNNDSSEAALTVDMLPRTHPGYELVNAWKLIFDFAADDPAHVNWIRAYSGTNDSDVKGAFVIAINVVWNIYAQVWQQFDATKLSSAVILHYGKLRVVTIRAGTAPWADWDSYPTSSPYDPLIEGAVVMTSALRAYALTTLGDATVGNDLTVAHAVRAESFAHIAPVSRSSVEIPIASGIGQSARIDSSGKMRTQSYDHTAGLFVFGGVVSWPIQLPHGATLGNIQVIHHQETGAGLAPNTFQVLKLSGAAWSGTVSDPGQTNIPAATTTSGPVSGGDATLGLHRADVLCAGEVIDNLGAEYRLLWNCPVANNYVSAIRIVDWLDPGPRNY